MIPQLKPRLWYERRRRGAQDKLAARNLDITSMLEQACKRVKLTGPPATAPLMRIDLRESAILETVAPGGNTGLDNVAEE